MSTIDQAPDSSAENDTDDLECVCEICQQTLKAKTLPLLDLAYQLHKREHVLEEEAARNRFRLVRSGSGWILTKSTPSTFP